VRYYRIIITDPTQNNAVLVPNVNGIPGFSRQPYNSNLSTYTSLNVGASAYDQGGSNPAAQMVEMDMPVTYAHTPGQNAFIKVWGVGLAEIAQASNLNGLNVEIYGGMAKGLPLANPAQSGLLIRGQILQSYGNWIFPEQSLSLYVANLGSSPSSNQVTGKPSTTGTVPLPTTNNQPANIVFQWKPGQPLLSPLVSTLQLAFPQYSIVGAVHDGLVWAGAEATGFFATVEQFAQYLNQKSLSIISGYAPAFGPGSYPGVSLTLQNNTITIADGTTQTTPKQIQFVDLVGQPTYSQPYTIQVTCVMRYDINCGDYITMPLVQGTISSGSNSQYFNPQPGNTYSSQKSGSAFSGTFMVAAVHHVGNSRGPDAASWVTTLDLLSPTAPQSVVAKYPVLYTGTSTS
jgi:hypothetical protein